MAKRKLTWTEKADLTPPWFCRWVARHKKTRQPKTVLEIAMESGLSKGTVQFFSKQASFGRITNINGEKFAAACGVDLLRQKRVLDYVRTALKLKNGMSHVNKWRNPNSKKIIYNKGRLTPMVTAWLERVKSYGRRK